jgi:hypothetical protein
VSKIAGMERWPSAGALILQANMVEDIASKL